MKIDYQKTTDGLKENGLILPDDKCAVCLFQNETESNGVTSTVISSKVDYIMAANADEIKLFDIDKKSGEYLYIAIHFIAENFVHNYLLPKEHNGFEQSDARLELYEFIKNTYNTHYDAQEKLYKGK